METFNRILYTISAVCVALTTVLFLFAIWGEIDSEIIWKVIGTGCILLIGAGIMLAINLHIIKIRAEIKAKKTN